MTDKLVAAAMAYEAAAVPARAKCDAILTSADAAFYAAYKRVLGEYKASIASGRVSQKDASAAHAASAMHLRSVYNTTVERALDEYKAAVIEAYEAYEAAMDDSRLRDEKGE